MVGALHPLRRRVAVDPGTADALLGEIGGGTAAGWKRLGDPFMLALSALLNGRAGLSGTMALRIEKAFGVGMDTLMRMQASYDIARARGREDDVPVETARR